MAAKEMYDYLSAVTPDYAATTLAVTPTRTLTERGNINVVVHEGDDGSEQRVALDADSVFYVDLQWGAITEADAGTILDFFHTHTSGSLSSFKWTHPTDGHTYVVRFDGPLPRSISANQIHGYASCRFKVLGRIND